MTTIKAINKIERMKDWPQDYNFDEDELQALQLANIALIKCLKEKKVVIIRPTIKLDTIAMQFYSDKFKKEFKEGLIFMPEYFEAIVVEEAGEIKIEGGQT